MMNRIEIEGYGSRSGAVVRNLLVNPFLPDIHCGFKLGMEKWRKMLDGFQAVSLMIVAVCFVGIMFSILWYWLSTRFDAIEKQIQNIYDSKLQGEKRWYISSMKIGSYETSTGLW